MSRCSGGTLASCAQAGGIIIVLTIGSGRPPRTSSSNTLSICAESEPGCTTGLMSSTVPANSSCAMRGSWLFIQLTLPRSVLISPLCASTRNGCASRQVGKVLVE